MHMLEYVSILKSIQDYSINNNHYLHLRLTTYSNRPCELQFIEGLVNTCRNMGHLLIPTIEDIDQHWLHLQEWKEVFGT